MPDTPVCNQSSDNVSMPRFMSPGWQQRQHSCALKNWRAVDHQATSRSWTNSTPESGSCV
eukprot:1159116-Pelagomonas_calceolata.AAC.2